MSWHRVIIVTGLSGAGKASILRALEDLGYEAVDNPPLHLLEDLIVRSDRPLAIGVDARSRGFEAAGILESLARVNSGGDVEAELIFASADETVLLRRFTETRRRHPLAPFGRVSDGISAETAITEPLREAANLVIDTSGLPLSELRRLIETRFGRTTTDGIMRAALTVSLISFAFPSGLPREADMVFDARFLRNPHYDLALKPLTGVDPEVAAYVEGDVDFEAFFQAIKQLLKLVFPRFVSEGKKYASIAVGCTGGRHRSVWIVQRLALELGTMDVEQKNWSVIVTHRELARSSLIAAPASS